MSPGSRKNRAQLLLIGMAVKGIEKHDPYFYEFRDKTDFFIANPCNLTQLLVSFKALTAGQLTSSWSRSFKN